jgi:5-methylcytosine-specific restriction enzyme subunit McrC
MTEQAGLRANQADIILREYESTNPLDLSPEALQALRTDINESQQRLGIEYLPSGRVRLQAKQYVGIISVPNGPTIEIRPKVHDTNLLYLLRYAHRVDAKMYSEATPVAGGDNFLEALAALFEAEFQHVFQQGITPGYRTVEGSEKYLRGRLDTQRQLQKSTGPATKFECTYQEHTRDILLNRAILYAAQLLGTYVSDSALARRLSRHRRRLREYVTPTTVRPAELQTIELTHLTDYYRDIFRLVELVISNTFVEDFRAGQGASFSLLVNMNTIFEKVVERGVKDTVKRTPEYRALFQQETGNLIQAGKLASTLVPDFTLQNRSQQIVLVGDAKWKRGQPTNADLYQLAAYQHTHSVPGVTIYPDQKQSLSGTYQLSSNLPLILTELPLGRDAETYESFSREIEDRISAAFAPYTKLKAEGTNETLK